MAHTGYARFCWKLFLKASSAPFFFTYRQQSHVPRRVFSPIFKITSCLHCKRLRKARLEHTSNYRTSTRLSVFHLEAFNSLFLIMEKSSKRSAFPDKKRESVATGWSVTSPSGRPNGRGLYGRFGSNSRCSSEDGSISFRRITSCGSCIDSSNSLKVFVYTPRTQDGSTYQVDRPTHDALLDLTRETQSNENRPPSPRPSDLKESLYEHNKQLHIWDDWCSSVFYASDADIASIKYKRTASESLLKELPRTLEVQFSDDFEL